MTVSSLEGGAHNGVEVRQKLGHRGKPESDFFTYSTYCSYFYHYLYFIRHNREDGKREKSREQAARCNCATQLLRISSPLTPARADTGKVTVRYAEGP